MISSAAAADRVSYCSKILSAMLYVFSPSFENNQPCQWPAGMFFFDVLVQQNAKKTMKKLMLLTVMTLFAWSMNSAYAQKPGVVLDNDPGWQKIGETVASFKSQDESIAVLGADEFAAIKLRVEGAPLQIDRLQVFYESGDMEEIDVKKRIQSGNESTVFRLKHPDRDIQKVAFTYNTAPNAEGEKAE